MKLHILTKISTIFAVSIFLMFLGMRLPNLDTSPAPKPRPRATLNQGAKTLASATASVKHCDEHPDSFFAVSSAHHLIDFFDLPAIVSSAATVAYPVSPAVALPCDRSPPFC